jgi:hypothetical protein
VSALLGPVLTLAALYVLFRVVVTGGWRRSGKRSWVKSPTSLLRGRSGPYRYSPKSPAALWSAFALTMVLSTQLITDSASVYEHFTASGSAQPSTRAVVTLLAVVGCLLAAIAALPRGPGNPALDWLGLVVAIWIAATNPQLGTVAEAALVLGAVLYASGSVRTAIQCGGIALSYYVLYVDGGSAMVTVSLVMTILMGTLTVMLITMRRTIGTGLALGILVAVALVSGLTLPIG